jgi:peptidoglycan/xylan/chitin deacetylase (PgdA/CDA1 family)
VRQVLFPFIATLLLAESLIPRSLGSEFSWPEGRLAAVTLTFDDARSSQVDVGLELLNRLGAKATFYVVPIKVEERLTDWKRLVASGYEIGNHALQHPCTGNFFWSRDAALENYTLEKMRRELISANQRLEKMLGVRPTTFAYPCGQTFVGRGVQTRSYVPIVAELFLIGRTWLDETAVDPTFLDPAQVTGVEMDGKNFDEVKLLVESARNAGQWLILAGHETGNSGPQTTRLSMLKELVPYLKDAENQVWFETVKTVGRYILDQR